MANAWVVNMLVDTQAMEGIPGKGTWERPVTVEDPWHDCVQMTAVSDEPSDGIILGTGNGSIELAARSGGTIKWAVSEVDFTHGNYRGLAIYSCRLAKERTAYGVARVIEERTNCIVTTLGLTTILNGFNASDEPKGEYLKPTSADVSIPQTLMRSSAVSRSNSTPGSNESQDKDTLLRIRCHLRMLLIDTEDIQRPKVIKYLEIVPSIVLTWRHL